MMSHQEVIRSMSKITAGKGQPVDYFRKGSQGGPSGGGDIQAGT